MSKNQTFTSVGYEDRITDLPFTEEWIPVKDLTVDREVQRGHLDTRKVDKIIRNFNRDALGVVTVSHRGNLVNILLDGAHRKEAVQRMTEGAGQLLCHVFRGLNKQQEAQIFLDLNGGNMPSLIDRFNVRIVAGDKVAQQVDETLRAYGWKAGNGRGNGTLQSVGAAEKVHRLGLATDGHAELFQNTIMVITRAWQNAQPGVMAPVLEAISALLLEYGDAISTDRLIKTMANYSGGPHGLLEDGKQLARSVRGRPAMGIAMRLVDEYNTGLKTRKLTAWRKRR